MYDQSVLGREKSANRPDRPPYPHPAGRRRADGGEHGCGYGGAVAIGGDAAHPGAGGSVNDRGICRPARRAADGLRGDGDGGSNSGVEDRGGHLAVRGGGGGGGVRSGGGKEGGGK